MSNCRQREFSAEYLVHHVHPDQRQSGGNRNFVQGSPPIYPLGNCFADYDHCCSRLMPDESFRTAHAGFHAIPFLETIFRFAPNTFLFQYIAENLGENMSFRRNAANSAMPASPKIINNFPGSLPVIRTFFRFGIDDRNLHCRAIIKFFRKKADHSIYQSSGNQPLHGIAASFFLCSHADYCIIMIHLQSSDNFGKPHLFFL